jgi:intracellular multiplication protein IcmQ
MASPEDVTELLEKFKETVELWPRDSGLFLELMREKLKLIEQQFMQEVTAQLPDEVLKKRQEVAQIGVDQVEVFIELYQSDGDNMSRWAMILNALPMQAISRPIYETESGVCSMIRAKENKNREGYAVVKVLKASIIKSTPPLLDIAGRALLQLKSGALQIKNVVRFVHYSGQYLWQNGKLIKLDLPSPIRERKEHFF